MSRAVRIIGALSIAASTYMGLAAAREWHVRDIYGADEFLGSKILSEQKLDPRLSYKTTREALTRCITTRSSTWFNLISKSDRTAIDNNCQTFAAATLSIGAKHSEAHILLALLGADMQDTDAVRENLAAAQNLAPRDRFNVEWRLILAYRTSRWSGGALTGYDCAGDLQLLEAHLPGNRTLAFLQDSKASLPEACAA